MAWKTGTAVHEVGTMLVASLLVYFRLYLMLQSGNGGKKKDGPNVDGSDCISSVCVDTVYRLLLQFHSHR